MKRRLGLLILTIAMLSSVSMNAGAETCQHPYPCGDEWPADLEGPFGFDLATDLMAVDVPSHDGTKLHGWVAIPKLPAGVRAPTVVQSSPYIGLCIAVNAVCVSEPDDPDWWSDPESPSAEGNSIGVPPIELVRRGYAVAYFNMRGTGRSEGCFQFFGRDDRLDQAALVEWVASQPWSNGRVGFGGASFLATTAYMAAVEAPSALKTVITTGQLNDLYLHQYTPQGARNELHRPAYAVRDLNHSFGPYPGVAVFPGSVGEPDLDATTAWLGALGNRACQDTVDSLLVPMDRALSSGQEQAAYWGDRRHSDLAANITAAMLMADGFKDFPDHQFQGDLTWGASPNAPKKLFYGWFGHEYPPQSGPDKTWAQVLYPWLDYWLKGIGSTPSLGVEYQDEGTTDVPFQQPAGTWFSSGSWPPAEAQEEVLYLGSQGALEVDPGEGSRSYLSLHHPTESWIIARGTLGTEADGIQFAPSVCQSDPLAGQTSLLYTTQPLADDVILGGNAFAYLRLSSSLDGGLVHLALVELAPDFECDALGRPNQTLLKVLVTTGSADLRHYQGNYVPAPFTSPAGVRVDFGAVARRIEAGHRLGLLVYGYELVNGRTAMPQGATITLHGESGLGASHLVLPIVQGSFGGAVPSVTYPPRPFTPPGYDEGS